MADSLENYAIAIEFHSNKQENPPFDQCFARQRL
jgi:hypothetical protein